MSVLGRYLLRESLIGFLGVAVVLALVLVANIFVQALALAADGSIPAELIPWLVGINAVKLMSHALPAALFLGLMFALGRLSRDSELGVMRACGAGPAFMLRTTLILAVPVMLFSAWLSLHAWPTLEASRDEVIAQAQSLAELRRVPTGRFIETPDGGTVAYVGGQRGGVFEEVFLYTLREGVPSVEFAGQGELVTDPETGARFVELRDGRRYEGHPGERAFTVIEYDSHRAMLPGLAPKAPQAPPKSSLDLLRSDSPRDHRELLKRLSQPLSALALAVLAIPLAQTRPRSGRYGRMGWAILIYAIYFNLVGMVNAAVGREQLDLLSGALLLPGLMIALALLMLWWQGGGIARLKRRFRRPMTGEAA